MVGQPHTVALQGGAGLGYRFVETRSSELSALAGAFVNREWSLGGTADTSTIAPVRATGATPWLRFVFRTPAPIREHVDELVRDEAADVHRVGRVVLDHLLDKRSHLGGCDGYHQQVDSVRHVAEGEFELVYELYSTRHRHYLLCPYQAGTYRNH